VGWEAATSIASILRVVWSVSFGLLHAPWVGWCILVASKSSNDDNVEDDGEEVCGDGSNGKSPCSLIQSADVNTVSIGSAPLTGGAVGEDETLHGVMKETKGGAPCDEDQNVKTEGEFGVQGTAALGDGGGDNVEE